MSANMRLVAKNTVDDSRCVLTSSVAATITLENLKKRARGKITRIPSGASFEIKATFGGDSVRIAMAALLWTNFDIDATWRLQGYSDAAWSTQVVDSGTVACIDATALGDLDFGVDPLGANIFDPFYGQNFAKVYVAETVVASWKLTISNTTNGDGYIDASRLIVGKYLEVAHNPVYGLKLGWKEATQVWETDGGTPHSDAGTPYRVLTFDIQLIPEADRQKWMDIIRYIGMRRDVFIDVMPEGTAAQRRDYAGNFIVQAMPDFTTQFMDNSTNYDSTNIVLREV